jgi:hypothetical protein
VKTVEVEAELLTAIDQLAAEGPVGEIRFLAALLACRGKVERRERGWQHPFEEFAEREGDALVQALRGLKARGIVYQTRGHDICLNSYIISRNKDFVCQRCANRLFIRAHHRFAQVLKDVRFDDLFDVFCRHSHAALNRASRNLGARFRELKKAGLVVSSHRAQPRVFHAMRWVEELPWAAGVALTLQQGNALTWKNCVNQHQMAFHMALATGIITHDSEKQETQLTAKGRTLADGYIEHAMRKRLRWFGDMREETMHLMLDELVAPLPSVWIDGRGKQLENTWDVDPKRPMRILLLKDRRLRMWFRRLVRRFEKLGLAQLITYYDGVDRYYFAPGAAAVAKDSFGLPPEGVVVPQDMQAQFSAYHHLAARLKKESAGIWRVHPDFTSPDLTGGAASLAEGFLRKHKWGRLVMGPEEDGAYRVSDSDTFRQELFEAFLNPIAEFLTTSPEEELLPQAPVQV